MEDKEDVYVVHKEDVKEIVYKEVRGEGGGGGRCYEFIRRDYATRHCDQPMRPANAPAKAP